MCVAVRESEPRSPFPSKAGRPGRAGTPQTTLGFLILTAAELPVHRQGALCGVQCQDPTQPPTRGQVFHH